MGGSRHPLALRQRARELYAAGEKLDYIGALLGVPSSTFRDWLKDMPRRRAPTVEWCPPEWRIYNKHLSWYWKVPTETRKAIIAAIAGRQTTKRGRYVIMKSFTQENPDEPRDPPRHDRRGATDGQQGDDRHGKNYR